MKSILTSLDTWCPMCIGTSCLCGILASLLHALVCICICAFIHASMHPFNIRPHSGSYVDKLTHGCPRELLQKGTLCILRCLQYHALLRHMSAASNCQIVCVCAVKSMGCQNLLCHGCWDVARLTLVCLVQAEQQRAKDAGDSSEAEVWRHKLHHYLDQLFQKDQTAGADYHVLQVCPSFCQRMHRQTLFLSLGTWQKEKKKTDYAFRRQFNEKPSIIPGCPFGTWHTHRNKTRIETEC